MFSMRSGGRNTGHEDCREGETVYIKDRSDDGWKPVVKGARVRGGHDDEAQVGALANAFSALAEEGRTDDEVGEPPVVGGWGFDSRKGRSPKQRISISPKFMSNMCKDSLCSSCPSGSTATTGAAVTKTTDAAKSAKSETIDAAKSETIDAAKSATPIAIAERIPCQMSMMCKRSSCFFKYDQYGCHVEHSHDCTGVEYPCFDHIIDDNNDISGNRQTFDGGNNDISGDRRTFDGGNNDISGNRRTLESSEDDISETGRTIDTSEGLRGEVIENEDGDIPPMMH